MSDNLTLYSFGRYDRSGKVRWLANELGITITEEKVALGDHRKAPFRELNPFASIPVVQWRDQTLIESSAICTLLAERYPQSGLIVTTDEPARADYLQWMAICSDTLESRLVEFTLAKSGLFPAEFQTLHERTLQFKLRTTLEQMPESGYLVAGRFTLADISLAYCLRLAITSDLIESDAVRDYLTPLMARPAAQQAGFFKALET